MRAIARPQAMLAPVFMVMLWSAMMVPSNDDAVPSVAELRTWKQTLLPCTPLLLETVEPLAVVSVEPIWNANSALGSPRKLRNRFPV